MENSYATRVGWSQAGLWRAKRPLLSHLSIELTERCNFNCIHCYINRPAADREARARELTTEQIKGLLKEAAELGALTVLMSGGEALLRPDFAEVYLFARQLGMRVRLFTNGSLITPEMADLFVRVPPRRKIEISVYGMSPGSYEEVTRVPGAYAAVQRAIHLLLERRVPFLVKGVLLPPNAHELGEFEAWAATLPDMRAVDLSILLNLRARHDSKEKNSRIARLRWAPDEGVRVLARNAEQYRREMVRFCSKLIAPPGDKLFVCDAKEGACIDAYGKLQPCMLLRHPDVTYDTVAARSSSPLRYGMESFFTKVREKRADNPEYLARCSRCFLLGLCEQCPAKSWMEHGTLDTPVEYLCAVAHSQARGLGLLHDGERSWEISDWRERIRRLNQPEQGR